MKEVDNVIYYEPPLGIDIGDAVQDAIHMARSTMKEVRFECNGIAITVDYASIPDGIVRDWYRAIRHLIGSEIGPRCEYPLSEESRARDAAITAKKSGK